MGYVSTKDMHTEEVKVRLTEDDRKLLDLLARKSDIKPAVLARSILVRALSGMSNCADTFPLIGRP